MEKQNSFGLWEKTGKSGTKYFSGSFSVDGKDFFISMFKNTYKKTDKHPDYNFLITPKIQQPVKKEIASLDEITLDDEVMIDIEDVDGVENPF